MRHAVIGLLLAWATLAQADNFNQVCAGSGCPPPGTSPNGVTVNDDGPQMTWIDSLGAPRLQILTHWIGNGDQGVFFATGDGPDTQIPFRVQAGASNDALVVGGDNHVGLGVRTPERQLHVKGGTVDTAVKVENTTSPDATRTLLELVNFGAPQLGLRNAANGDHWKLGHGATGFIVDTPARTGVELRLTAAGNLTIKGTLTEGSDHDAKRDVAPIDPAAVLAAIEVLPIATWRYADDPARATHLGPMAQDFQAAFGLGEDPTRLSPRDAAGVALAGVQGLAQRLAAQDAQIQELRAELAALRAKLAPAPGVATDGL